VVRGRQRLPGAAALSCLGQQDVGVPEQKPGLFVPTINRTKCEGGYHHACADAKCPCVPACPHGVLEIRPLTAADKRLLPSSGGHATGGIASGGANSCDRCDASAADADPMIGVGGAGGRGGAGGGLGGILADVALGEAGASGGLDSGEDGNGRGGVTGTGVVVGDSGMDGTGRTIAVAAGGDGNGDRLTVVGVRALTCAAHVCMLGACQSWFRSGTFLMLSIAS
jgi:hypothetical protein